MSYAFGKADQPLENAKWFKSGMETHGGIILINSAYPDGISIGIVKNITTKTYGCEHAEDVAIRTIKSSGLLVISPAVNHIILSISKSPCSSTYGTTNKEGLGCTEELINFQNTAFVCPKTNNTYYFRLTVIARGVYKQSDASHEALTLMAKNGVEVTTDVHRKMDGSAAKKEYVG
jgi:pyrimidine deaminase RibD-like protein